MITMEYEITNNIH